MQRRDMRGQISSRMSWCVIYTFSHLSLSHHISFCLIWLCHILLFLVSLSHISLSLISSNSNCTSHLVRFYFIQHISVHILYFMFYMVSSEHFSPSFSHFAFLSCFITLCLIRLLPPRLTSSHLVSHLFPPCTSGWWWSKLSCLQHFVLFHISFFCHSFCSYLSPPIFRISSHLNLPYTFFLVSCFLSSHLIPMLLISCYLTEC